MQLKDLEHILSEVWSLQEVSLQGIGEPLLHPQISEMISLVKRRGLKLGFVTSAVPLSASLARDIVKAEMDWIGISFDASSKGVYEHIRVGANYEDVLENVRGLIEEKKRAHSSKPYISIAAVAMRWNISELVGVVELFGKMGADQVSIQNFNFEVDAIPEIFGDNSPMLTKEDSSEIYRAFEECRKIAEGTGIELSLPPIESQWQGVEQKSNTSRFCLLPWTTLYVTVEGFVTPCCNRPDASRFSFGNLIADGFNEIWGNERCAQFRQKCMSERLPSLCQGCTLNVPLWLTYNKALKL